MKGLHGFCGAGGLVLVLDMQRRRQQCKQVFSGGGADEGWAYTEPLINFNYSDVV
jgi:hypothetical protein